MTIASLNTVAKTFAKIAKTFAGFSTTIIATRRRPVLILHLEAKYAKIYCKNEIFAKNWVRSTWTAKVNGQSQPSVKVNDDVSRCGRWCQQVTWQWWRHLRLTTAGEGLARGCAWRKYSAREEVCRCMEARVTHKALTQNLWVAREGAWRLRWLRGFHQCVDRLKTILVIPL